MTEDDAGTAHGGGPFPAAAVDDAARDWLFAIHFLRWFAVDAGML